MSWLPISTKWKLCSFTISDCKFVSSSFWLCYTYSSFLPVLLSGPELWESLQPGCIIITTTTIHQVQLLECSFSFSLPIKIFQIFQSLTKQLPFLFSCLYWFLFIWHTLPLCMVTAIIYFFIPKFSTEASVSVLFPNFRGHLFCWYSMDIWEQLMYP